MLDSCYGSAAEKLRQLLYCNNQSHAPRITLGTLSHMTQEPLCRVYDGWYTRRTSGPAGRSVKYQQDIRTIDDRTAGIEEDLYTRDANAIYSRDSGAVLGITQLSKGVIDAASIRKLQPTEDLLQALVNHSQELDEYCEALKDENDVMQEEVKILRDALAQFRETQRSKLNENLNRLERLVQSIEECKVSKNDSAKLDLKLQQHSVTSRLEMIQMHGRLRQSSSATKQLQERERSARARVHEAVLVATAAQLQVEQYANKVKELERELNQERRLGGGRSDSFMSGDGCY